MQVAARSVRAGFLLAAQDPRSISSLEADPTGDRPGAEAGRLSTQHPRTALPSVQAPWHPALLQVAVEQRPLSGDAGPAPGRQSWCGHHPDQRHGSAPLMGGGGENCAGPRCRRVSSTGIERLIPTVQPDPRAAEMHRHEHNHAWMAISADSDCMVAVEHSQLDRLHGRTAGLA